MKPLDPRLLRHAAAARPFIVGTAVVTVASTGLVLLQADLLAGALSRAFLDGAGLDVLAPVLLALLLLVVGRAGLAWWGEVLAHRASANVIRQLRAGLVTHVLRLGPRHHDLPPEAELATLASRGLDGLAGYFGRYLPTLLVAAVLPAVVAGRILFADWISGLVVGLTVPLIPIFMILIGQHTERSTRRQWRSLAQLGHHFLDLVSGLDVLVAYGRASAQAGRITLLAEQYRRTTMRTLRTAFLSALALEVLATLSVALIAVSVGLRLLQGSLDLRTALLVLILAPEVYLPLRAVGARFHDSAEGLAAVSEVLAVLDVPAVAVTGRLPAPDPSQVPLGLEGVTVDGRGGPILEHLDLAVAPGSVLGVTGPSGAGKSTLLDLLLGLRRPDGGRVTVGGVDLATIDRDTWLRRVAWVPQHPVLLAGTVADNIALSEPAAGLDRVRAAATAAALDLPLDTPVGEAGVGLSTGQQRRVALARALLADRPLLLVDEPTEGVDADTEATITANLAAFAVGRTVVVVSHRRSVLAQCDRVVQIGATAHRASRPATAARDTPTALTPARSSGAAEAAVALDRTPPGALRWALTTTRGQRRRLGLAALCGAGALGCGVALIATSAWLISSAALHPPVLTLMVAIVAVRAFGLGKGVLRYLERLLGHDAALRAATALRVRLWTALVHIGPAATARIRRGDLLSRLLGDVDAQHDLMIRVLLPVASSALVAVATALGIGLLLPSAGVVVAVGLLAAGVGAPALTAWSAHRSERHTATARSEVLARTVEVFEGSADLIAAGAAPRFAEQLNEADIGLGVLLRRAATARGLGAGLAVLAIGATSVAATAVGIAAVRSGAMPGTALAVLALTPLALAESMAGLPDAALRLSTARASAARLAELESRVATVAEPSTQVGAIPPAEYVMDGVAVRWPGARSDAVADVDLALGRGTGLVLTGPSGSGKSTVVAALLRWLEPTAGTFTADGRNVQELTGDELRRGIGWCGAWTHLFDSSLRANLALAAPDCGDERLVAALRDAQLGEWLLGLPDGLDTRIGQHGGAVSGGERQRIGLARVLLADRPVMVLDEPTAHLDPATADALAAELTRVTMGRTALIVTHRPEQTPGLPVLCLSSDRAARSDHAAAALVGCGTTEPAG